ncbi:hypothetical protein [Propioniciclava sp. MC1683]|uniref:hypothetical protein n=1 Tax=Propioniciclava sp. MC1683 TaxID=2760309 RepID=UPI001C71C85B|nr:hypothetical protein [Propioniciclava sp. MC1683]
MDQPPTFPEAGESRSPRALRDEARRVERERRQLLAEELAAPYDGVVTLAILLAAGLTRGQIEAQVARGAWHRLGRHTVAVRGQALAGRARWWHALWESGRHAALDGATALLAAGLKGWSERDIDVTVPNNARVRPIPGVRHHRLREQAPTVGALRRTRPEVAAIRAAQWAVSDAEAATVLAMAVQQRLVSPGALLERWRRVGYSGRRKFLDVVIEDICNGAESLGELDFARMCRARGLPEPSRQVLRTGPRGRAYLDVFWDDEGVHVEIHGAHHYAGLTPVEDALRANDLAISGGDEIHLQVPVLGLRLSGRRSVLLDQVERALVEGRRRAARRSSTQ